VSALENGLHEFFTFGQIVVSIREFSETVLLPSSSSCLTYQAFAQELNAQVEGLLSPLKELDLRARDFSMGVVGTAQSAVMILC